MAPVLTHTVRPFRDFWPRLFPRASRGGPVTDAALHRVQLAGGGAGTVRSAAAPTLQLCQVRTRAASGGRSARAAACSGCSVCSTCAAPHQTAPPPSPRPCTARCSVPGHPTCLSRALGNVNPDDGMVIIQVRRQHVGLAYSRAVRRAWRLPLRIADVARVALTPRPPPVPRASIHRGCCGRSCPAGTLGARTSRRRCKRRSWRRWKS